MAKINKYILLSLLGILIPAFFVTVFYFCRTEIPACREASGELRDFRYYFDESKNEWVAEESYAVVGEDVTAVRIDDFAELNFIDKVNYVPDEFVVPSSNPISYDFQTVSLNDSTFAQSGSIVIFLLNLDPEDPEFSAKAEALDKYKVGDYWEFSVLLPKVFTAANIYLNSSLTATVGEIADYEFIEFNTSDDRVTLNNISETERLVLTLKFYTRREALNNNVITIHYRSESETLAGLRDPLCVGSHDAVNRLRKQYPVTFIIALIVSAMIFFVFIVLSFLKKTTGFLAETALVFGVTALALANYLLAGETGVPLFWSALRYSANFLIPGAASLTLAKGYRRAVPLFAFGLHAAGFVMSFILPYVSVSASEGISVAVTLLKILSAATLTCLIFLPSILKKPLPSLLRTFCGGVAAVNVASSVFIAPTSEVLLYPPIWLYFALTVISFLTVISIIANTERENAYITANLNSEVERQVKDIRAVVTERDKLLQFISHDLKKPLVFGENHLDILLEREKDDEQIKLINIVRQNNKKVLENLTEIAGYARFNYIEEPSRPIELSEICDKLYNYCTEDCKAAGILLKNDVDRKAFAFAKPQGLENALTNIILNAIEHADCTEITLSLRSDRNKILISVKDNGKGISPDLDVFRPYVSENDSEVGGLGLYICKSIIESMNGELTYSSGVGGTVFTVALLKA